jgi:mannosylglucosylglycerate synthase
MSIELGHAPGRRVAIVHYTAPPAIGGIEGLMVRQRTVLAKLGHRAVHLVGRSSGSHGAETIEIPLMDPSNDVVAGSIRTLDGVPPSQDHPLVQRLMTRLGFALEGCTDCWIHNALTVSLNPFLTAALELAIMAHPEIRWVAWTADISSASRFVPIEAQRTTALSPALIERVTWIAISHTRRLELEKLLDIEAQLIRVVSPPLDVPTWLDLGSQARSVIAATNLLASDLVVFVPAKALHHKGLDRTIRVARVLARDGHEIQMIITAAPSPHEPHTSARVRQELRCRIHETDIEADVTLLPDLLGSDATNRTVRELMQLSDVVLLPSIEEGFGMPLLEAAACRVPVVCTDIPVFREVAADSAVYFDEAWGDDRVASLVVSAAKTRDSSLRRTALSSMQRFESDIEALLRSTGYPNV